MRLCKVCEAPFEAHTNYKCCSVECSETNRKRRMKAWNSAHPERIAAFKIKFNESLRAA